MSTRAEELRRRSRRTFTVSFVIAAAVHVWFLTRVLDYRTSAPGGGPPEEEVALLAGTWRFVDAHFGPPEIVAPDGSIRTEPPERVLDAPSVNIGNIPLPPECAARSRTSVVPGSGRVRVVLNGWGRVAQAALAEGSGDACRDRLLVSIAKSVWYRWIPNKQFPAPVELVQPISLVEDAL